MILHDFQPYNLCKGQFYKVFFSVGTFDEESITTHFAHFGVLAKLLSDLQISIINRADMCNRPFPSLATGRNSDVIKYLHHFRCFTGDLTVKMFQFLVLTLRQAHRAVGCRARRQRVPCTNNLSVMIGCY